MAGAILWNFAEEERRKKALRVSRRAMRDASNPLALPHKEFVAQFRLTKEAFGELCREIIPILRAPKRNTMIRNELKVSIPLYPTTVPILNTQTHVIILFHICIGPCSLKFLWAWFIST